MAQPQKKDSPEWVVIADDWVDIDEKIYDDFDQAKSINDLNDHVKSPVTAKNEKTSGPKVMTHYIDVPEDLVNFFAGKDVVMDLQIASGAMIQVTELSDVNAKGKNRAVRMIGNLENVAKAEKLIKAVVALADAGGTALLRKHDCDTNNYGTKYGHHQKQGSYPSHVNVIHDPESWGPFQFDRKHSHKRSHGKLRHM